MTRTKEELGKLTVADLKAALKEHGLPLTGKKEELVERLFAAETSAAQPEATTAAAVAAPSEAAAPAADEAADPAPVDATAEAAPTTEPPKDDSKHAKIVFSDDAIKAMPTKITVIKTVEPAKPFKSDVEKLKERADRFKDPAVEKAKLRAERFGTSHPELDREKARKRAERFGTYNKDLDEERKAKRAERFGIEDPEAKLSQRAARFGIVNPPKKTTAAGTGAVAAAKSGKAPIQAPAAAGSSEFSVAKQARAARFGLAA